MACSTATSNGRAVDELTLAKIRRQLEEFEPASARGERIGTDPEAMLVYAEEFSTATRTLLAEVERLRASEIAPCTPKPYEMITPARAEEG